MEEVVTVKAVEIQMPRQYMKSVLTVLFLLSAMAVPRAAMAQFWGGCRDAAGRPVMDYPNDTINDIAVSSLAPGGAPIIQYNPRIFLSVGPVTQRFFYLHECGHHALGQVLTGSYIPLASEQDADCWAAREMLKTRRYTTDDLRQVQLDLSRSPGDWSHLPGPQRALNLLRCVSGGGCRTVTEYESQTVMVPRVDSQRIACQHCGYGYYGWSCQHAFDVVYVTVQVPVIQRVPVTRTICTP